MGKRIFTSEMSKMFTRATQIMRKMTNLWPQFGFAKHFVLNHMFYILCEVF